MFSLFRKRPMLDKESQHKIVACIKEAESKTSGEIRVFMEHHCQYMDGMHRAQEIFANLFEACIFGLCLNIPENMIESI